MSPVLQLHIEVNIKDAWYHYNHISRADNLTLYRLLGFGIKGVFNLKKIPDDISEVTRLALKNDKRDIWDLNWKNSTEIQKIAKEYKELTEYDMYKQVGFFFGNTYEGWSDYPEDNKRLNRLGLRDFRWIYWFMG